MNEPVQASNRFLSTVSVCLGALAVGHLAMLSWILYAASAGGIAAAISEKLTGLDVLALSVSASILLAAMIQLFRQRKLAVELLAIYLAYGCWVSLAYSVNSTVSRPFRESVSLVMLLLVTTLLVYTISQRTRDRLS